VKQNGSIVQLAFVQRRSNFSWPRSCGTIQTDYGRVFTFFGRLTIDAIASFARGKSGVGRHVIILHAMVGSCNP
jgi:hypothetical protein